MELRHLRYFVIVAEEQNVTRAAARLHVSQPPLSRQILDLEAELGVALFQRTAKSVALTEAGKIFLNEARAVLLRAESAVQTVRAMARGEKGCLRIGYAPSLTIELLPKALRLFENGSPGIRVSLYDLSTEECIVKLAARKLDMALTVPPGPAAMRGLVFEKLLAYPLCCAVAVSHSLAQKRSLKVGQLQDEKFIIYSREEYPEYDEWLRTLCRTASFEPRATEEYDGVTGLIAAVEAGRGVAVVPSSLRHLAGPRLKLIPLVTRLPALQVGALLPRSAAPLAAPFLDALRTVARSVQDGPGSWGPKASASKHRH